MASLKDTFTVRRQSQKVDSVIKYFRFKFIVYVKITTTSPLEKITSLFPSFPPTPSKNWDHVKPRLFWNFGRTLNFSSRKKGADCVIVEIQFLLIKKGFDVLQKFP